MKNAKSIILCLVIKGATLDSRRGEGYLANITSMVRILSDEGVKNLSSLLLPLINEANTFGAVNLLKRKINQPLDVMQLKQEARNEENDDHDALGFYNGLEYPMCSEEENMAKLVEFV